jgi:hypothetical protein
MGRRTVIELLHVAAGLMAAAAIAGTVAGADPLGREVIWWCGAAAQAATLAMAVGPLRRAWAADQSARRERRA